MFLLSNPARNKKSGRTTTGPKSGKDGEYNPFPIDRKDTDSGDKAQGYTSARAGRPCTLSPESLGWSLPIGKGRGANWDGGDGNDGKCSKYKSV